MDSEFFLGNMGFRNTFMEVFKPPVVCSYCRYGDLCYNPDVNRMHPAEKSQVLVDVGISGKCDYAEGINYQTGEIYHRIHRTDYGATWEAIKIGGKDVAIPAIAAVRRDKVLPFICSKCFFQKDGVCSSLEVYADASFWGKSIFVAMDEKNRRGICDSGALHNPDNAIFKLFGVRQGLIRKKDRVRQLGKK